MKKLFFITILLILIMSCLSFSASAQAAESQAVKPTSIGGMGYTGDIYEFSVHFNGNIYAPTVPLPNPPESSYPHNVTDPEIMDKVMLNGKTLNNILQNGTTRTGVFVQNAIQVNIWSADGGITLTELTIYVKPNLSPNWGMKNDGSDTLTIPAGMHFQNGNYTDEETIFTYDDYLEIWVIGELPPAPVMPDDIEFTVTRLVSIDDIKVATDASGNPIGGAYIMLYFDLPASYKPLRYVSVADEKKMVQMSRNPKYEINLSINTIRGMFAYKVNEYMVDYFKIDGKTIRNIQLAALIEAPDCDPETSVAAHYMGDSWNVKGILLTFDKLSNLDMSRNKAHSIEIMAGFTTPLCTRLQKDQKYTYDPQHNTWSEVVIGEEEVDYTKLLSGETYVESNKDDCNSSLQLPLIAAFLLPSMFFKKKGDAK